MVFNAWDGTNETNPPARLIRISRSSVPFLQPYIRISIRIAIGAIFIFVVAACESSMVRQVDYYEKVGDFTTAHDYLLRELERQPDNSEARFLLGQILFQMDRYVEGREAFEETDRLTGRFSERIAYTLASTLHRQLNLGVDALNRNDIDEAVRRFTYASEVQPDYSEAYRARGHAQVQAGALSNAVVSYQMAVDLAPEDIESWNNLSEIAFVQERYADAVSAGSTVVAIAPDHLVARRRMARAYLELKQADEAVKFFEGLIADASDPNDIQNFAYVLFNLKRFQDALPHLEHLANTPQPDLDILRTLSETYNGLERYDRVVTVNERILSMKPEDRAAIGSLIAAYERLGLFDKAQNLQSQLAQLGGEM